MRIVSIILALLFALFWASPALAISAPVQVSPNDGNTVSSTTLTWQAPSYSLYSGSPYRVQVDDETTFTNPPKDYYTANLSYTPTLSDGTWYWRVKAKDSGGTWSEWSSTWSFILSSSSPSPTPTPSPSSTSSFAVSNVPSSIDSTQTFTTSVNLELSSYPNTKFYLKGAFVKSGSTNYFGFTKVVGNWVKNNSSYSSQYEITTDSGGKWSGNLEIQPDVMDSGYEGTNDYIFKVGRYTSSGNGPTWGNEVSIKINAKEVEMAEENINLSALSVPKSSPVLGASKKQEDLPETVYSLERYKKSASRSAVATPSSNPKTKVKGERINFLVPLGAILVIIGAVPISYAIYHQIRKRNQRIS